MPVRSCSASSNSASHFWLSRGEAAEVIELLVKAVANSAAFFDLARRFVGKAVFQRFRQFLKLWMRAAMSATGEPGNSSR